VEGSVPGAAAICNILFKYTTWSYCALEMFLM
jgi:hypothetical protein